MKKRPLEYALYLLELRDRTEGEIRQKMRMKKYETAEIEETVKFLKEKDFIDDERFVKNYITNKQAFGATGKYKIRQKLMLLHLDHKLIDENLAETDLVEEKERATELAKNWLAKKKGHIGTSPDLSLEKRGTYEKLGRFLATRGFEIDIVKDILQELLR